MSDERYQQRQQRVKEKVDARVAQARDERGIIIVFTGNGKGKTTAAFGTATRAVGHGKKWASFSLLKAPPNGERKLLEPHGVEFQVMATGFTSIRKIASLIPPPAVKSGNMPNGCWLIPRWIWFCSMS